MTSKLARRFFLGGASAVAIIAGAALNAATFDFSFTGAMQSDTTTQAGTYRISIGGASGGDGAIFSGGTGARILGDVYLGAGSYFKVLVGGNGESGFVETGGGGMSYFRAGANLAVAGGGGGAAGYSFDGGNGGASASDGGGTGGGGAGTAGNTGGGGASAYFGGGGGGAGIDQNGGDAFGPYAGMGSGGGQTGPTFAGGTGRYVGGFGGGGGGSSPSGVGGGGGYFGGGGGYFGGGGSSHFSSLFTNTSMFDGGATNGAYVSIDLIAPIAPVPLPAGALLMGTALAGFGALRRRKTTKSAVNKT
jgi:hypothetical protein